MTRSYGFKSQAVSWDFSFADRFSDFTSLMARSRVSSTAMLPGIPAALFMAVTQKLPKASSSSDRSLGRIMAGAARPTCAQRLLPVLANATGMLIKKITRGEVKDVRSFRGEREQSDDVLAIRWRALKVSIF
jgi:hypothetical protein